jgi:hypothetical protein
MFRVNEANWDRILRVVAGIALLYFGLSGMVTGALAIVMDVLGAIWLVTGVIGFCPTYALLGISTKKSETV